MVKEKIPVITLIFSIVFASYLLISFNVGFIYIMLVGSVPIAFFTSVKLNKNLRNLFMLLLLLLFVLRGELVNTIFTKSTKVGFGGLYHGGDEIAYLEKAKTIASFGFNYVDWKAHWDQPRSVKHVNILTLIEAYIFSAYNLNLFHMKQFMLIVLIYSAIFLFLIARRFINDFEAFTVMSVFMFYPSILFWHSGLLKEPIIIFSVLFFIFCGFKLLDGKFNYIVPFIIINIILILSNVYIMIIMLLVFALYVVFCKVYNIAYKYIIFILICIGLQIYSNSIPVYANRFLNRTIVKQCWGSQVSKSNYNNTGYSLYPYLYNEKKNIVLPYKNINIFLPESATDFDTLGIVKIEVFLHSFLKGILFFIFAPFPWSVLDTFPMLVHLQMILWYLLIPFFIYGVSKISRKKDGKFLFFIFCGLALVLSVFEGNIGTLFRHRDWLTPIFLIIASVGIFETFSINTGDLLYRISETCFQNGGSNSEYKQKNEC